MAPLYWGFGGVDGPDRAWQVPRNPLEFVEVVLACFDHQFLEAAAGEGVGPLGVEGGGARGAPPPLMQLGDLLPDRVWIERLRFLGAGGFQQGNARPCPCPPAQDGSRRHQPQAEFAPGKLLTRPVQVCEDARNHFEFFLVEESAEADSSMAFKSVRS